MREILIIGFGNPLRGDDGVGWHCVRLFHEQKGSDRLATALRGMPVYEMACQQLEPELAERLSTAHFVIFIDASVEGVPGSVVVKCLVPAITTAPFHHQVSPELLLTYAASLFGRAPGAAIITVTGEAFEIDEQLSDTVQASLDLALDKIAALLDAVPPQ